MNPSPMQFLTDPTPHDEAMALIADKPAVARDVFDQLPEELKGRAFTITGVEDFDVLQSVRDHIAALPAGADWDSTKKEIMAKISPWFTPEGAEARANLLLTHHANAAYSACNTRVLDAQMDIFPYRQYESDHRDTARPAHLALDRLVFPADNEFWKYHTPQWDWNCHCGVVGVMADEHKEIAAKDKSRDPSDRLILSDSHLAQINDGTLTRGNQTFDVRTPKEKGGTFQWSPRDQTVPYDQLKQRWDPDIQAKFETWADGVQVSKHNTLLDYMQKAPIARQSEISAAAGNTKTFAEAMATSGMDQKSSWKREDIANLRALVRVANPVIATDLIRGITGARASGVLTTKEITRTVQDMLDILPREIAETLPKVQITIAERLLDEFGKTVDTKGDYLTKDAGGPRIRINMQALKNIKGERRRREMRRILSHELAHWLHMDATSHKAIEYRLAVKNHYHTRTAGDVPEPDGEGGFYRKDRFWKKYAGREYKDEHGIAAGLEIPSCYFELWETPEKIMQRANLDFPNAVEFRETLALVMSIFNSP